MTPKFIKIIDTDILLQPAVLAKIPSCSYRAKDLKYCTKEYWMTVINKAFTDYCLSTNFPSSQSLPNFIRSTLGVMLYPSIPPDFLNKDLFDIHCQEFNDLPENFIDKEIIISQIRREYYSLFYNYKDSRIITGGVFSSDYVPYAYILKGYKRYDE